MSKKKEVLGRFTRQELMNMIADYNIKLGKSFPSGKEYLVDFLDLRLSNKQLAPYVRLEHLTKDDLLTIAKSYNLEYENSWPETKLMEFIIASLTKEEIRGGVERLLVKRGRRGRIRLVIIASILIALVLLWTQSPKLVSEQQKVSEATQSVETWIDQSYTELAESIADIILMPLGIPIGKEQIAEYLEPQLREYVTWTLIQPPYYAGQHDTLHFRYKAYVQYESYELAVYVYMASFLHSGLPINMAPRPFLVKAEVAFVYITEVKFDGQSLWKGNYDIYYNPEVH